MLPTRPSTWRPGATYNVVEQSPDLTAAHHDRRRHRLNHIAFHIDSTHLVDTPTAAEHGWSLLFPERHPHAGGTDHYAAYLETPTASRSNSSQPSPTTHRPMTTRPQL